MSDGDEDAVTTSAEPGADLPGLPLIEDSIAFAALEKKPTWRGWIHAATFPLAIALGIVLVTLAHGGAAKASTAVYFAASLLLFGTSALYHRINWSPKVKAIFRRADHSNIFLLIAGTYTPIVALCLPSPKSTIVLIIIWAAAALGIGFRLLWLGAPRWLYVPLYLLLGFSAFAFIVDLFNANAVTMILVLAGGLAYTLGAVAYGLKKPNPVPGVFGFHEVFHSFTLLAFLCHWTGILIVAISPPVLG